MNGRLGEVAVMRLLPKSTRLPFVGAKRKGSVMLDKFRLCNTIKGLNTLKGGIASVG